MDKEALTNSLWVEKYRPKSIDDIVLPENIKSKILEYKKQQEIPNILLVGDAGIGKTSLAKIIVNEIIECEVMEINASDEGGIDMVRSKVKSFASSASMMGLPKIIILGEADGLTKNAQDSLKEIIEESSATTRFIFTANDITKMSKPIRSRCQRMDIDFTFPEFFKHITDIFRKEGIKGDGMELMKMCKRVYPDFRLAINTLQMETVDGVFTPATTQENSFVGILWAKIKEEKEPEEIRKFYIEKSVEYSSMDDLAIQMAEYAFNKFSHENSRKIILLLNKCIVDGKNHPDKELNFYCMIIDLCNLDLT